jgi:hypothetical protein
MDSGRAGSIQKTLVDAAGFSQIGEEWMQSGEQNE